MRRLPPARPAGLCADRRRRARRRHRAARRHRVDVRSPVGQRRGIQRADRRRGDVRRHPGRRVRLGRVLRGRQPGLAQPLDHPVAASPNARRPSPTPPRRTGWCVLRRVVAREGPADGGGAARPARRVRPRGLRSVSQDEAGHWTGRVGELYLRWSGDVAAAKVRRAGRALLPGAALTVPPGEHRDLVLELSDRAAAGRAARGRPALACHPGPVGPGRARRWPKPWLRGTPGSRWWCCAA